MAQTGDKGKLVSDQRPFALIYKDFFMSKKLTAIEKLVFVGLKMHMNWETEQCFPSLGTLATEVGISKSSVQRAITKLEKLGVLRVEHRKGANGEYSSNVYTLYDIQELWSDVADQDQVASKQQEADAINLLQALGYEVTRKEKKLVPDSAKPETSTHVQKTTTNNDYKSSTKSSQAKNRFNNFTQREYNFTDLETKLLGG